ncbi:MAG: hypothetical protein AVDCRST_MAG13-3142, partial [uncultured Solirubrobacteraceae bacterium]
SRPTASSAGPRRRASAPRPRSRRSSPGWPSATTRRWPGRGA